MALFLMQIVKRFSLCGQITSDHLKRFSTELLNIKDMTFYILKQIIYLEVQS